ncbi:MAG: hypothetical protein VW270_23630 [Candidatus Poseidoniales archaeon]
MAEESTMSVDKLVKVYLKITAERTAIKKEFDDKYAALTESRDRIKQALLNYCKEQGVESVRTSEGLFYRTVKRNYWTSDWDSMYEFIIENKVPEFFDKRLNQKNVREFLDENPDKLPKGLNSDSTYTISVRSPKK